MHVRTVRICIPALLFRPAFQRNLRLNSMFLLRRTCSMVLPGLKNFSNGVGIAALSYVRPFSTGTEETLVAPPNVVNTKKKGRKVIKPKAKREIIQIRRAENERHEKAAAALGLGWRIVGAR